MTEIVVRTQNEFDAALNEPANHAIMIASEENMLLNVSSTVGKIVSARSGRLRVFGNARVESVCGWPPDQQRQQGRLRPMTVFLEHDRVRSVITCDATGCEERRADKWRKPAYGLDDAFLSVLLAEGWSEWMGRSRRHYCPKHGPRPGSQMRLVWGNAR